MSKQLSKFLSNLGNNQNHTNYYSKGFSLLELIVGIIISVIILSSLLFTYTEFMRLHTRQNRVMIIERSLNDTSTALRESLTTLPARAIATSNGTSYSIPLLPYAGSIFDGTKNVPIRLGAITPYKINGNDAFTITYADTKIPRLPLDPTSSQIGSLRIVRVALPTGNQTNHKDEPGYEPNPSPSSNTISALPTASMFEVGQLMLIVESPTYITDSTGETKQTLSLLVKLASVNQISIGNRQFLEFRLETCQNGGCGQLSNDPLATGIVSAGATLVPLHLMSFYLKKDSFGNKLIKNEGGLIIPDGNGGFTLTMGKESIESVVGETDSLKVDYHLSDGTVLPTPNTPIVPWLNQVTSVDTIITGSMAGTQGSEYFSRTVKINFPVISNNIK